MHFFDGGRIWQYNYAMNGSNIYKAIYDYNESEELSFLHSGKYWSFAVSASSAGIAMNSADFEIESMNLAKANCHWNRGTRYVIPFDDYCTAGLDFSGKTVGLVGNLKEAVRRHKKESKAMYIFDFDGGENVLSPADEGKYLPECDITIITGSSIQNGTLPKLLELCRKSFVILTGPSVPQCTALLDFGIDRISGLIIQNLPGIRKHVINDLPGSPFSYGVPFMISK